MKSKKERNLLNFERRQSEFSYFSLMNSKVQFALSQTPPVETVIASGPTLPRHQHSTGISNTSATTHHTLSPVIQCFQNDK
ncbi:hypothetical protein B9Z55_008354 [Caenorhabditis nigoni]|uniref:Uncharacterized protein n=1 Tax=Caenorhabditis nigoni TaxID=1611254 RepID=A0A2G5UMD1_9PELO|nr:hypothetical protein B9Z55_008354 [Caenorhabditis nigoni]